MDLTQHVTSSDTGEEAETKRRKSISSWVVDETTKVSLFVDVSESSLSVGRCRGSKSVRFFVAVAVVDGALCRWLSSTATELSLMALSDSLR
ncbi:hypothetical protein Bca4012_101503 [Brassica carinata]